MSTVRLRFIYQSVFYIFTGIARSYHPYFISIHQNISSELSTRLSGRYVEIPIHSLTYRGFGFNLRGSIEKVMENAIHHHLVTQRFKVTVGILRNGEVDFVAVRDERRLYVQAVYLLGSEETVAREFGNLQAIRDNYPKYFVSRVPVSGGLSEYPGIIHVHLREFLMTDF